MNVYFASSPSKQHIKLLEEEGVENLLISYHFIKKPKELAKLLAEANNYEPKRLIIDSGAFSVWANGGTVDREAYVQFCLEVQKLLPSSIEIHIVNLDVIPGEWGSVPSQEEIDKSAEAGWQNMLYLESFGLKVIHVFHQHEKWEVLDRLVAHSDYIGISPANDVSNARKQKWMAQVFKRLDVKNTKIKTHGFAVTSHNQLYSFPYYSADSSSWVTPARYGRIGVLNERFEMKTFSYKNINELEPLWDLVRWMGIDKMSDSPWKNRTIVSIRSYKKLGEIATRRWKEVGLEWID